MFIVAQAEGIFRQKGSKMTKNFLGVVIAVASIAVLLGLAWLAQYIPFEFFLKQWPGIAIGISISVLGMGIGELLKKREHDE